MISFFFLFAGGQINPSPKCCIIEDNENEKGGEKREREREEGERGEKNASVVLIILQAKINSSTIWREELLESEEKSVWWFTKTCSPAAKKNHFLMRACHHSALEWARCIDEVPRHILIRAGPPKSSLSGWETKHGISGWFLRLARMMKSGKTLQRSLLFFTARPAQIFKPSDGLWN